MAKFSVIYLEAYENYQKQSYRNRCYIMGPGGREMLQIPVIHENGTFKLPIRQIRVDYSTNWVIRMERAIQTAYSSAAFFPYYKEGLFGILESKEERLWDLNLRIIRFFCSKAGISTEILLTEDFEDSGILIHPKHESDYKSKPYFQVFAQKYGFINNLSFMDLLFNEGPDSISFL